MKRFLVAMVAVVMLLCISAAWAESWVCPNCGTESTGNFCSNCGAKKDDGTWICPNCGLQNEGNFCGNCGTPKENAEQQIVTRVESNLIRLDLDIGFEKNSISSTYDVKMYLDDQYIATLAHGTPYKGSLNITPGSHTIKFHEDGDTSVNGSAIFTAEEPALFSCVIHAKWSSVNITGERLTAIDADAPLPGEGATYVNGNINLSVKINFERNVAFSKYDVDMYLDGIYVTTLPHGNDYEGVLGVSSGEHTLVFYKAGSKSVSGTSKFSVNKDASFSCKIEATSSKVKVTKEQIK